MSSSSRLNQALREGNSGSFNFAGVEGMWDVTDTSRYGSIRNLLTYTTDTYIQPPSSFFSYTRIPSSDTPATPKTLTGMLDVRSVVLKYSEGTGHIDTLCI